MVLLYYAAKGNCSGDISLNDSVKVELTNDKGGNKENDGDIHNGKMAEGLVDNRNEKEGVTMCPQEHHWWQEWFCQHRLEG